MKKYYILSFAASLFFFASCEKETMFAENTLPEKNDSEDYFINPEDTAGIVVPEGHALVVFPGSKTQTRAALEGNSDRISNLKYIVYQLKDGEYVQYGEVRTVFNFPGEKNWPYQAVTTTLPTADGLKYKVVFLGNVDNSLFKGEEVLSGVGDGSKYTDARIHLPSIGNFTAQNLFHWCTSQEFDPSKESERIIPIKLQRIVSRSILTTYGIPEGVDAGNTDKDNYSKRFYSSLLDKNHPLGLGEKVFGAEGIIKEQIRKVLERDIVFPIVHLFVNKEGIDKELEVVQWYNQVKDTYWDNYVNAERQKGNWYYDSKESLEQNKTWWENNGNQFYNKVPNDIVKFANELYKGESLYIEKLLAALEKDKPVYRITSSSYEGTAITESYSNAKKITAEELQKSQKADNSLLKTWFDYGSGNMRLSLDGEIPSCIDFDLNVQETKSEEQSFSIPLSPAGERNDRSLEIILLGERTDAKSYKFNPLSLSYNGKNVALPETDFPSQALLFNQSTTYRIVPEIQSIGDKTVEIEQSSKIVFSYQDFIDSLMEDIAQTPISSWEKGYVGTLFKAALYFSAAITNVGNITDIDLDWNDNTGLLSSGNNLNLYDQPYIEFKIPDFSTDNLNCTLKWEAK